MRRWAWSRVCYRIDRIISACGTGAAKSALHWFIRKQWLYYDMKNNGWKDSRE